MPGALKIVFVDPSPVHYQPAFLDDEPLGGSQSAMLLVARELSHLGMDVTVIGRHFEEGQTKFGFSSARFDEATPELYEGVDVIVSISQLLPAEWIRLHFGPRCRYVAWHHNDSNSPDGRFFRDRNVWRHVDRFVFASHYQASDFVSRFRLPSVRVLVIGNPVPNAFLSLFPQDAPILLEKDENLLVYASAPNRGLERLIRLIFPELRKVRPELRLEVHSGFYLNQGLRYVANAGQEMTAGIDALLAEAEQTPGVALSRGIAKQELAQRLKRAMMLVYPTGFRETFCSSVREAMAAGCIVSTTRLGALSETTAGFGVLSRPVVRKLGFAVDPIEFVQMSLAALEKVVKKPESIERSLRLQVNYVRENSDPARISTMWRSMLEET